MNPSNRVIVAIGMITITVTLILFFLLTSQRSVTEWSSLLFLVVAEGGFFGGVVFIGSREERPEVTALRAGGNSTLAVGSLLMVIVSILFLTYFRDIPVKYLVAIQIVLMTAAIVSLLGLSARSVALHGVGTRESVASMRRLVDKIDLLLADTNNRTYGPQLMVISEALRYSDFSSTVPTDTTITAKVLELEQTLRSSSKTKDDRVGQLVDTIHLLVQRRSTEVKTLKMGGF